MPKTTRNVAGVDAPAGRRVLLKVSGEALVDELERVIRAEVAGRTDAARPIPAAQS